MATAALKGAWRRRLRAWARRRQGVDCDGVRLRSGRIYIVPNAQGFTFALLMLATLFGAMNYNNSLGLAVAFLLAGLGLVAMHHCQRNLAGLIVRNGADEPAFAGRPARFDITLVNDSAATRFGITLRRDAQVTASVHLEPGEHKTLSLHVPTTRRGRIALERFSISTTFPLGLFHCWAWLHPARSTLVYPQPAPPGLAPPPRHSASGDASESDDGDADFAGLRPFRAGDSPRHVAWKAYARDEDLLVKQYAGTGVTTHWFDFSTLDQMDTEARLSQLTRWVLDAYRDGHAWGLRLPAESLGPDLGPQHRDRCLRALALA